VPAIEVEDLHLHFGALRAVDGLSFTSDSGEVLALLGPNGAGKTTTVEALVGYRRPDAGRVRVLGCHPVEDRDRLNRLIGVMPQEAGVYPGVRPLEILRLYAAFHERSLAPEVVLDRVGLGHKREATWRQLSGGEQQRLSLAMALIGRPTVVFLDEPAAGMDVRGRQLVRRIVRELTAEGVAVLVTTHDLDEAEKIADRVVIIDRGRLAAIGTPSELMASASVDEIRFGAPAGLDTAALGKSMMAAVREIRPGEYLVETSPTPANVAMLATWLAERDLPLADLRAGRQRLEDVFLRLTSITGEVPVIASPEHRRAVR
jgi:ABC-2 type transport system ATP-binding protein